MLLNRRVDLTPLSDKSPALLTTTAEHLQKTAIFLSQTSGYLAMSKNIPEKQVLIWQQALDQLKNSGRFAELEKRYLRPAQK